MCVCINIENEPFMFMFAFNNYRIFDAAVNMQTSKHMYHDFVAIGSPARSNQDLVVSVFLKL